MTSIKSVKIQIIAYVTGISVYGLSKKNLNNMVVPLPPIEEQTKIASILSGVNVINTVLLATKTRMGLAIFLILFVIINQYEHYSPKENV